MKNKQRLPTELQIDIAGDMKLVITPSNEVETVDWTHFGISWCNTDWILMGGIHEASSSEYASIPIRYVNIRLPGPPPRLGISSPELLHDVCSWLHQVCLEARQFGCHLKRNSVRR